MNFSQKKRNIKNYKGKSSNELLRAMKENNQQQSKNKERIDIIREELKESSYRLSKSELKEIKKNLYNTEKRKQFESEKINRYLDELDKNIR